MARKKAPKKQSKPGKPPAKPKRSKVVVGDYVHEYEINVAADDHGYIAVVYSDKGSRLRSLPTQPTKTSAKDLATGYIEARCRQLVKIDELKGTLARELPGKLMGIQEEILDLEAKRKGIADSIKGLRSRHDSLIAEANNPQVPLDFEAPGLDLGDLLDEDVKDDAGEQQELPTGDGDGDGDDRPGLDPNKVEWPGGDDEDGEGE